LYSRRYFERIIAVSEDIAVNLLPDFGAERLEVVYNSVEMPVGDAAADRLRIRREFGLDDNNLLIGTAGRLTPVKAYDQFLLAAKEIAGESPRARFLIAGDGPLGDELKSQAKQLGLAEKVIFPGFRNDMPAVIAAMDLFVMSSLHEGIPVVLLEAMALARPVVVTAVGGIVEVVQDGRSGRLVQPGNARELAEACKKLIRDPDSRTRLGLAAADRVRSEFTRQNQSRRLIEVYGTMIKRSEASK
jgi:glycosyltransferase involved in cell wall biosynthesis